MSKNELSKNSLRNLVSNALHDYFAKLEGTAASDLYNLVVTEIEAPLIEIVMHYTNGNQSKAATWLGINRGTLRKLLAKYNLA